MFVLLLCFFQFCVARVFLLALLTIWGLSIDHVIFRLGVLLVKVDHLFRLR